MLPLHDAKHTTSTIGSTANVTTGDQAGLFGAVLRVNALFKNAGLNIGDVRLLFVTNRKGLASQQANSTGALALQAADETARRLFSSVELELLNKDTFEFGPFSDILATRRI